MKKIDGLNSKLLRRQIYEENKEEINNNIINILQEDVNELRTENRRLYQKNIFELSDQQREEIDKWDKEHECTLNSDKYVGAIGGHLSYEFIPTSIGVIVNVKCSCGQKLDVSNSF